ncbi:TPA: G5 domain-containing protein [Streptococcus suis]|nr:G5 domain-containing protein [Streptococcus suis]
MHKFFYEQRKAFSFRKLTIGLVSLCVGTSLLVGIQFQEVSASTVSPSQIRFEYVLEAELSAEERQLIQSSLPAELKEEATYFVVYRPSKKVLPATGELAGSGLAVLGLGFLVLAVSATKSKKARVLTMLYVTTSGLALPVLEVGAVQSSALAAYNQTYVLKPGEALPDGRLTLAGYDFVGYYVQESSVKTSLPPSETEKNDAAKGTQASSAQSEGKKSELEEFAKPSVLQENSESQLSNRDDSPQLPLKESSVEKTENTVSSETTNSQTGDGLASPSNTSTVADKKEDSPNTEESQNSGLDSTLQIPGLLILNRKDRTDAVTEVAPVGQALPFVAFRKEKETVALELVKQEDPQLEIGKSRLVPGQEGEKEITYADFVQGEKILRSEKISEQMTKNAVAPIMYVGTKQVEAPVIPLPEVPSSPKVESEISDAGSTDANSSASQHTEQPKPSTPDSAVDLPVPPQPEVRPEVDVPVPPQPETTPETEEPVAPQPEVVPETEEPVAPQPEVVPETTVPVAPQLEVVPETEEPVAPQPEVVPETEEPVAPQPETTPETEEPVASQPEEAPETEVPVAPQPEVVLETEEPVAPQPEVVPETAVPVAPQPEVAPETAVPVAPQPEVAPETEELVAPQPEVAPETEEPVAPQPEVVPETEEPVAPQPEVVPETEVAVAPQPEAVSETEVPTTPNTASTDATSGASQHGESTEKPTSQELTEAEIQCILDPSSTCWPEKEEKVEPKVQAQQIEEAAAKLREKMEELQTYKSRFKGKEWTDYINTVYEDSRVILETRDLADMLIQTSLIEDDIRFLLIETDANSGASQKTEGELIFELPTSTSETVTPPLTPTTPDSSGSTTPKPSDSTTAPSTETEEEFCPIDPKPEENCGVESEPQKETPSGEGSSSSGSAEESNSSEANPSTSTIPDSSGSTETPPAETPSQIDPVSPNANPTPESGETSSSETSPDSSGTTAPKPSDSTTAPSTETEEEFCPIDPKPEENCGVESEPQKETPSGEGSSSSGSAEESNSSEANPSPSTIPDSSGTTAPKPSDSTTAPSTETEEEFCPIDPKPEENCGVESEPQKETPSGKGSSSSGSAEESNSSEANPSTSTIPDSSGSTETPPAETPSQIDPVSPNANPTPESGATSSSETIPDSSGTTAPKPSDSTTAPSTETEEGFCPIDPKPEEICGLETSPTDGTGDQAPPTPPAGSSDSSSPVPPSGEGSLTSGSSGETNSSETSLSPSTDPDSSGTTTPTSPVDSKPEEKDLEEDADIGVTLIEDISLLPKPTMNIRGVDLQKDKKIAVVRYALDDPAERYEGAVAYLYANDKVVSSVVVKESNNQLQAVFENLDANVDYVVRTELTYMGASESLVDSLADEASIEIEERQLQIKNIDRVELWKFENGKASIQRELATKPTNLTTYFAKVISNQQKEILLPISQVDLQSENGESFYLIKASLDNLVEDNLKDNTYSSGLTFRVAKQKASTSTGAYTDFTSLVRAMQERPGGTFTLGADLTASTMDVTGKDSYITGEFTGTLNGAGYTIYDLQAPLFHKTSGRIENLNLKDVTIHQKDKKEVGALAKEAKGGHIENVRVEGSVTGGNHVGALVGIATNTQITNVGIKARVSSQSTETTDNYVGGLAGWIGQGGQAQRIYSDVLLTSNSERARIGGIVGQMEGVNASVRKAYAKGMISAPKTINSEIGGIVGTIVGSHNSIIEDVISAINVPNGRKVYHSVTDEKLQVGKNYAVTGEASGQDNSKQEHLEASQVDGKLTGYGIQSRDTDARNHSFVSAKVDTDYSTHPHYQENRQLAYENMEKLLPFFTKDVIIQQANRLNVKDKLVTTKLLDVVAIDGHNKNRPVFDTQGQKQYINKVMFHFEDGSIDYDWLVKKQDLNSGAITEYYVVDREVTYTPENMVSATHLDQLVTRLLPEFESLNYSSKEVLDVLGLTNSSNDYAIKELLFLKESFGKVKANIRQHMRDLLVSNHAINLTSQVTEDYTFNYIKNNKVQLLLGLAYMDRWYNIQFGATNAKDWMTKKADFFGNSASSLNQLITLGDLGAGALKPNNNFALGSQLIAKPAVNGDLFAYLEAYRKRFAPEMSDSDWFKSATKANIIETNSTVEEVRAKQEDANNKKYSNRFYDKLKSDTWSFKEMALILLTMPERNIFILTDMANTLIGSYDNQSGTKEEIEKAIAKTAKTWAGHADYLYRILPSGHKEKMFRQIITWDNRRLKGSWRPVDSLSSRDVPSMKDFYMPLGYSFPYGTGATAQSDLKDIFYSNADAIGNEGARIYTHELTHVADDDTFLLGHGRRSSMEFEVYARGLFETINWFDQDILGFNTIYDFSEYEKNSYGRRLTNLNPERFQSTQDLEQYMKGYLDLIYTLDYLEGEAVLSLAGDNTLNTARRNWFNKLDTKEGNAAWIEKFRRAAQFKTIDELIDNGMVSRRSYDPDGHSDNELFPGNSYLTVNALNPIYGAMNNDGPSRNEFEFRKIAFELLAEKGYENGFVPYLSNQYKAELGQADPADRISDNQLISKITDGVYADSKAFRKDMFKRRKEKLDQLKPVTIYGKSDGEGYYYSASRQVESVQDLRQLMKEAVEYDAHRSLYASQKLYASQANGYNKTDSRVYSLKAAILNGYLRATDDFRQSIYKDTP